jgi:hypothetical protein
MTAACGLNSSVSGYGPVTDRTSKHGAEPLATVKFGEFF